ncbi:ABC transporter substrate-binding protein [Desulfopila sp. IMCC35006]|uniref:substrate-binding domain-containing protein n=1 Tax=Desulfopila sp. IMCC35006 TaxID=2569542 RepID=UPI0010AD5CB9|nr:substrate-binding domain-containing protein [Desulfopila sp. IMCC35006]TKB25649.1 ABC transporter substrate-binding protein [Desulfopila sp. IMCC35006]
MKIRNMLGAVLVTLFVALAAHAGDGCEAVYGNGDNLFTLATGSPGELGLLKKLADEFNRANGTTMCWKKAGSGKSLKLLQEKKVDLVLVHAPAAEKKAVAEGWAIKRTLIGSNEFYIVGPKDDPAGIAGARSAADAYSRIAAHKAAFFSRGDNSGTNKKELSIWKTAGVSPAGNWYIITKDFMMATLKRANDSKGYFMTDSSTWVAGQKDTPDLKILFKGDPVLINTYHGLCQPEGATKGQPAASKFIDFIGSPEGQAIIGTYGKDLYGTSMYDDAAYAKQYVH